MTTAKEIKSLYSEYKIALDAEHATFDDMTTTERELDAAIVRTLKAELAFKHALVSFTCGAITERDVARMMVFKKDELESLIDRLVA